jgi:hypothetical protein
MRRFYCQMENSTNLHMKLIPNLAVEARLRRWDAVPARPARRRSLPRWASRT